MAQQPRSLMEIGKALLQVPYDEMTGDDTETLAAYHEELAFQLRGMAQDQHESEQQAAVLMDQRIAAEELQEQASAQLGLKTEVDEEQEQ